MAKSTVAVRFTGDVADLKRSLGDVDGRLKGVGGKLAGLGKAVVLGLGAAAAGAAVIGKGLYNAAIESQKVTKQTEAVIKSMGGASKVSADQVADLATKLSLKAGADDEMIQSGANVLLTFGQIRNEVGKGNKVFDRATAAALDMSVALGMDMKSASILVGKALNDPIKGLTALGRSGIQFTEQQKDQIKWLVANGKTMSAQKIILGELDRQFAGSAAAQATAGDRLKVAWGNVQEELGAKLVPVVEKVATWLADKLPAATDTAERAFSRIATFTKQIFNVLFKGDFTGGPFAEDSPFIGALFTAREALQRIMGVARQAFNVLFKGDFKGGPLSEDSPLVDTLFKVREAMVQVMGIARQAFDILFKGDFTGGPLAEDSPFVDGLFTVREVMGKIVDFIKQNTTAALAGLGAVVAAVVVPAFLSWAAGAAAAAATTIAAIAPVVAIGVAIAALATGVVYAYQNFDIFRNAVDAVASFLTGVAWPKIQEFAQFIIDKFAELVAWTSSHWAAIREAIGHVLVFIRTTIGVFIDFVSAMWRAWGDDLMRIVRTVWNGIRESIDNAIRLVQGVIQTVLALINGDWGKAWDGIKSVVGAVWDQIGNIISTAVGLVRSVIGGALSTIGALWSGAWDHVKGKVGEVWEAIKGVVAGGVNAVAGFVHGLGPRIAVAASVMWDSMKAKASEAAAWVIAQVDRMLGPIDEVIGRLGRIAGGVAGGIGGAISKIPGLHTGGVFHAPTPGGEGLALLRDRERVVTPEAPAPAGMSPEDFGDRMALAFARRMQRELRAS